MSLAAEKDQADAYHDAQFRLECAEMAPAIADVLQEFSLLVEEAGRRAADKLANLGALCPIMEPRGELTVRLDRQYATARVGAELAIEAREQLSAFFSNDAVRWMRGE